MSRPNNPGRAPIIMAAFLAAALAGGAALLSPPGRHRASRTVTVPPAKAVKAEAAPRVLSQGAVTRAAVRCLTLLCETGASDAALSQTRGLATHLGADPRPFAARLSSRLNSVLAYRTGSGSQSRLAAAPLPGDLALCAAAACDARGRRRPGEIVLSFAGDCTFGTVNGDGGAGRFPAVFRHSRRPDYPFALVRPWLLNDDLSVVNFECTLTDADRAADKQWKFKGPARYASIFPAGSVEAAGLSNNHSHDYLQAGFDDTAANFGRVRVPVFYQNRPYVTHLQGVETVLIGDCTVVGENTTLIGRAPERVLGEIRHYKKPGNIVIVVMHWGSELDAVPRPWQQALGREFIDAGADAVVGHHPHVVQGIEHYKGRYIAYSLGNFAFGGNSLVRHPETFLLRLRFRARGGETASLPASIVPCWTTSSRARTSGVLRNDYQPKPVFGRAADRTVALVLARSAELEYGVKQIDFLRLK